MVVTLQWHILVVATRTMQSQTMRALMNLAIEPTMHLFEVSTTLLIGPSKNAICRVLKVLADTPQGAIRIVRNRYPQSRRHEILACHLGMGQQLGV